MSWITHKITYLEMWFYILFFNTEHSQVHMSACYLFFQFCSQDLFEEFWKRNFPDQYLGMSYNVYICVCIAAIQREEFTGMCTTLKL